jgi:CRISPR/Cas system-associated exonuclease Cas4 (RecB family)
MTKNLIKQMMKRVEDKSHILDASALIEKINSGYVVNNKPAHTKKTRFAPSTLVWGYGECPRYWHFAFDGNIFERNDAPYDVANMRSGTLSHDRIQDAMLDAEVAMRFTDEKTGKPTTEFKVINEDPPIMGYCDAMLVIDGEEIVGEIKTMRSEAFDSYKIKNEPNKGHIMQLLIYMKILKKQKGTLIYENKNNHELLVFPIEVTDAYIEWMDNAFEWMREVVKTWKDKTIPQKNYRSNSKICKGCPVKAVCATAEPGVVKLKSLEGLIETM